MKKICCLVFAILTLASCSSSDDSSQSDAVLLKKIIQTSSDNSEAYVVNYTYNGNKLVSAVAEGGDRFQYIYTGNLITTINVFTQQNVLVDIFHFT